MGTCCSLPAQLPPASKPSDGAAVTPTRSGPPEEAVLSMAVKRAAEEEAADEDQERWVQDERVAAALAMELASTSIDAGMVAYAEATPTSPWAKAMRSFASVWSAITSFQGATEPSHRRSLAAFKSESGAGGEASLAAPGGRASTFGRQVSALRVAAMSDLQIVEARRRIEKMTEELRTLSISAATSDVLVHSGGETGKTLRSLGLGWESPDESYVDPFEKFRRKARPVELCAFNHDDFDWAAAMAALEPVQGGTHAEQMEATTSCALAAACLQLSDSKPDIEGARPLIQAATEHLSRMRMRALLEDADSTSGELANPVSALAHVWEGVLMQFTALLDGRLAEAKVMASLADCWEKASALNPNSALAWHARGVLALLVSSLPVSDARILRALAPGLSKYTSQHAIDFLSTSERLQQLSPCQYCVTSRSMIGRAHLQQGSLGEAREWLVKAVDEVEIPQSRLDSVALESRAAARRALDSLDN